MANLIKDVIISIWGKPALVTCQPSITDLCILQMFLCVFCIDVVYFAFWHEHDKE